MSKQERPSISDAAPFGQSADSWRDWVNGMAVTHCVGVRCTEFTQGQATFVLERSPWPLNPNGAVHGGLVAAVADHCMGVVSVNVVDDRRRPSTATMTTEYLRPAIAPLTFEAAVERAGRTLIFVSVDVRDTDGRVAVKAHGTMVTDGSSRYLVERVD